MVMEHLRFELICFLVSLVGFAFIWQQSENRKICALINPRKESQLHAFLANILRRKMLQILTSLVICFIIIVLLDRQNTADIERLSSSMRILASKSSPQPLIPQATGTAIAEAIATTTANPPLNSASSTQNFLGTAMATPTSVATDTLSAAPYYPEIVAAAEPDSYSAQQAVPLTAENLSEGQQLIETEIPNDAETPESLIEKVYNPEKEMLETDTQSSLDDIKKRYEDILVLHMYMKHCNKAESNDYSIINAALAQEMASLDAPSRLLNDIVDSAKGSYSEIYADSPCQGPGIGRLVKQYKEYIDTLRQFSSP